MKRLPIVLVGVVVAMIAAATVGIGAGETPTRLRIIYTNDLSGNIEPCKWPGNRSGGLARRVTLINQLVKENPNCVIVDSGNQSSTSGRIGLIADVLALLKYDAIGVGMTDLQITQDFLRAMSERRIPVLFTGGYPMESTIPYLIRNVGGTRVGIVSFGGIMTPGANGIAYPVRKALYSAFVAAREKSDLLVLLDQSHTATPDWIERNAARLGRPDVIVGGFPQSLGSQAQMIGGSLVAPVAAQAKSVGVVDVEFTPGSTPKCTARLILLQESIPQDEAVAKRVDDLMAELNKQSMQPAAAHVAQSHPVAPARYYHSSKTCKSCHPGQYEDWARSPHAQGVSRLVAANRSIPDCLTCHSELYRITKDPAISTTDAQGIECMTCHNASLPHGMERRASATRIKVDPKTCLSCHTSDKSPDYSERTYLPRVAHTGGPVTEATAHP